MSKWNKLLKVQKTYADKNIDTRLKENKLVFTKSGNAYRGKLGTRHTAYEVISGDTVKLTVSAGNQIEDNGNLFASHATTLDSFKKFRESLVEIMWIPTISGASHNVIAYRFVSKDGIQHEGQTAMVSTGPEEQCYVPCIIIVHNNGKPYWHWMLNHFGRTHSVPVISTEYL